MQDRFKFRHWDKQINKMRYGDIQIGCNGMPFVLGKINDEGARVYNIDNVITMQCTGLKDKNGKLIYEGDIIKLYNSVYEVIFEKRAAYFGLKISNNETYFLNDIHTQTEEIEIIGNIYENPKLLEVQND